MTGSFIGQTIVGRLCKPFVNKQKSNSYHFENWIYRLFEIKTWKSKSFDNVQQHRRLLRHDGASFLVRRSEPVRLLQLSVEVGSGFVVRQTENPLSVPDHDRNVGLLHQVQGRSHHRGRHHGLVRQLGPISRLQTRPGRQRDHSRRLLRYTNLT